MPDPIRNPTSLGFISGLGIMPITGNRPGIDGIPFKSIHFQYLGESHAFVGYADMEPHLGAGEGVLGVLCGRGDTFDIVLSSEARELFPGDFAVCMASEDDRVLVTATW